MKIKIDVIIGFSALFLLFLCACILKLDPDFGWHLQSGNYILAHWVPSHDIYTYTAASFKWINHEWLTDVLVASLFKIGNYGLVAITFAFLWAVAFLYASRKQNYTVLIICAFASLPYMAIRPTLFSILFLVILERIIERVSQEKENTKKLGLRFFLLIIIPLMFVVWANMHAGFVLGLAVLVFYKLFKTPFADARKKLPWIIIITSFLATFINPYGYQLYIEVARTLFDASLHKNIIEWASLTFPSLLLIGLIPLFAIFFAFQQEGTFRKIIRKKKLASGLYEWAGTIPLLPVILFCMSLSSTRYFIFFVIISLRYFEEPVEKFKEILLKRFRRSDVIFFWIAITAIYFCFGIYDVYAHQITPYPVTAVSYLNTHSCEGNVFNFYGYGGYLIWKLPKEKVYIDGRMPSWKQDGIDYFADYLKITTDPAFMKQQFTAYNITCVLYPDATSSLTASLYASGWQAAVHADDSVLLLKPQK